MTDHAILYRISAPPPCVTCEAPGVRGLIGWQRGRGFLCDRCLLAQSPPLGRALSNAMVVLKYAVALQTGSRFQRREVIADLDALAKIIDDAEDWPPRVPDHKLHLFSQIETAAAIHYGLVYRAEPPDLCRCGSYCDTGLVGWTAADSGGGRPLCDYCIMARPQVGSLLQLQLTFRDCVDDLGGPDPETRQQAIQDILIETLIFAAANRGWPMRSAVEPSEEIA